jgi:choline kinase
MLAAGIGDRLGGSADGRPKVLMHFGGESLLARHIAILRDAGLGRLTMVTGHNREMIEDEIDRLDARDFVRTVFNSDFREGSVVSMHVGLAALDPVGPFLFMDGDVLYDRRMIERLVGAGRENRFLLDREFLPGDEPVKLCLRAGRFVEFRKKVEVEYDLWGESVGFFRFSPDMARILRMRAEAYLAEGRRLEPYEEVIRDALLAAGDGVFGYEDVTGLPWVEIDFPGDIRRAETEILPLLRDGGAA